MRPFELVRTGLLPFLPVLDRNIRGRLRDATRSSSSIPEVLDVGGRESPYTIGVRANITITDLPRETDLQKMLHLGITQALMDKIRSRRSNIRRILFDDMTQSAVPDSSFDGVVAVEVLEHVEEDGRFLDEVHRVLKPGGFFLMSTPNGDFIENKNPDHKRHYTRTALSSLLASRFDSVEVEYAVCGGRWRSLGLQAWSVKHPLRTVLSMVGNMINGIESAPNAVRFSARGPHHLIGTGRRNPLQAGSTAAR